MFVFVVGRENWIIILQKNVIALRPEWEKIKIAEEGAIYQTKIKGKIKPNGTYQMIMTRGNRRPKEKCMTCSVQKNTHRIRQAV